MMPRPSSWPPSPDAPPPAGAALSSISEVFEQECQASLDTLHGRTARLLVSPNQPTPHSNPPHSQTSTAQTLPDFPSRLLYPKGLLEERLTKLGVPGRALTSVPIDLFIADARSASQGRGASDWWSMSDALKDLKVPHSFNAWREGEGSWLVCVHVMMDWGFAR